MVRWIAFILFFLFILPAFADKIKKTENIQELDEKTRLEFDYSFMEGVRSKITGDYQAAIGWFDNCLKILPSSSVAKYEIAGWIIPSRYFCISYSPQPSRSKRKT